MKRSLKAVALFLLPVLIGCGGTSGGGGGGTTQEMASNLGISFTGLKGFVIAPAITSREGREAASSPQLLYAIESNGTLTVVNVTASSTTGVTPSAIYDTPKFTLFQYVGVTPGGKTCRFVAARKTDAALFCIEVNPTGGNGDNRLVFPTIVAADATGNYLFIRGSIGSTGVGLVRLNFTDPASPVAETLVDARYPQIRSVKVSRKSLRLYAYERPR